VAGVAGLFAQARIAGAPLPVARSVAVNALVMFEAFYLLSARHIRAPVLNLEGFFGNRVALAAVLAVTLLQLVLTYLPFMQRLFGTAALDVSDWLRLIGVAALIVPLVEAEKYLVRRNGISRAAPPVDVRG
jgi:magnesium-transporting ATPase (P-type)